MTETSKDTRKASSRRWREANREKIRASGRKYACEHREQRRAYLRKWRAANRKKDRQYSKDWRKRNPEKSKASSRNWQKAHPDQVRANNLKWREANREKIRASHRKWRVAHPEKVQAMSRKRYAQLTDALRIVRGRKDPKTTLAAFLSIRGLSMYDMKGQLFPEQNLPAKAYDATKKLFRRKKQEITAEKHRLASLPEAKQRTEANRARIQISPTPARIA